MATLGEIFDMRSDSEHVHVWERSLQGHEEAKRHDIAWQRTRQIETLASVAYSRILLNTDILGHFQDDVCLCDLSDSGFVAVLANALEAFWKQINDGDRRKLWGKPLDLESIPFVENYDGFNRRRQ